MLFEIIDEVEFRNKVDIKFDNILEGFNKYCNGTLQSKAGLNKEAVEEKLLSFFEKVLELNGEENSFVDFYYQRLSDEDKNRLKEFLTAEDEEVLSLQKQN